MMLFKLVYRNLILQHFGHVNAVMLVNLNPPRCGKLAGFVGFSQDVGKTGLVIEDFHQVHIAIGNIDFHSNLLKLNIEGVTVSLEEFLGFIDEAPPRAIDHFYQHQNSLIKQYKLKAEKKQPTLIWKANKDPCR